MKIDGISRRYDGLTVLQLRLLRILVDLDGISIVTLGEALRIDRQQAWENIRVLANGRGGKRAKEGRGLVAISINPSDRRSRSLSLTPAGQSLAEFINR